MLLAVKVANAQTAIGVFDGETLVASWTLTTHVPSTPDELAQAARSLFASKKLGEPDQAILCSVVPALTQSWVAALERLAGGRPLVVGPGLKSGISMGYKDPGQLGADRVACAVAARELVGAPVVVADFDAAISLSVVGENGTLLGGAIAPGLDVSLEALRGSAAQLPEVEMKIPQRVIGRTTADAIRAGVVFGEAARLDGLIDAVWRELDYETALVACGRHAELVTSVSRHDFVYRADLPLQGLRFINSLNR